MKEYFFCLNVEAGLQFQDADFMVSSPISKPELENRIAEKLFKMGLETDLKKVEYQIKDGRLCASGWAYKPRPLPGSSLIM